MSSSSSPKRRRHHEALETVELENPVTPPPAAPALKLKIKLTPSAPTPEPVRVNSLPASERAEHLRRSLKNSRSKKPPTSSSTPSSSRQDAPSPLSSASSLTRHKPSSSKKKSLKVSVKDSDSSEEDYEEEEDAFEADDSDGDQGLDDEENEDRDERDDSGGEEMREENAKEFEEEEDAEWWAALRTGKIDDRGNIKQDPAFMTARQRAMIESNKSGPSTSTGKQVLFEDKNELSQEQLAKKQEYLQRRKILEDKRKEESKEMTIQRLLKKQTSSRIRKEEERVAQTKAITASTSQGPFVHYSDTKEHTFISLPAGYLHLMPPLPPIPYPPPRSQCEAPHCKNSRKYSMKVPLRSSSSSFPSSSATDTKKEEDAPFRMVGVCSWKCYSSVKTAS